MKKIVFLLFICLNLFAKEVYDLRNEFVVAQIDLGTYPKILDDKRLLNFAEKHLNEEYAKLSKIKDLVDRDDKKNELIQKAKTMIITPQIGDELIFGNQATVRYIKGKIVADIFTSGMVGLFTSDRVRIGEAIIVFEPTTREVLKEIVNNELISYEIVGTITKLDQGDYYLKDLKIKIFDDKNKQIDIKELISGEPGGNKFEMEYK